MRDALGGSASYFVLGHALRAGAIVAVVGEDFPRPIAKFPRAGASLRFGDRPGTHVPLVGRIRGEIWDTRTLEPSSTFDVPPEAPTHRRCPFVFLANIDPDRQLEVLGQMESPRLIVSDTMNYWIARKPERVIEVLRRVDVALLNEEEARALAGETQLVRAAGRLLDQGAKAVIVKKGSTARSIGRGQMFITAAYPVWLCDRPAPAIRSPAGFSDGSPAADGSAATPCARRWRAAPRWRRSRRAFSPSGSSRRARRDRGPRRRVASDGAVPLVPLFDGGD